MNKRKIVFFEASDSEREAIQAEIDRNPELKDSHIHFSPDTLTSQNVSVARNAEVVSTFINSQVSKDVIDSLPDAKYYTTRSTGFDHLDGAYAKSKGVKVSNVPAYGSRTVAEYAFSLILGLSRKTFAATLQVKTGGGFDFSNFMGFDLQGKTIGVVGTGRIGQNAAMIAKGFDMNVLAYDAFPNQAAADKIGFKYVSLDELLAQSDVVTLHVPYNKDTHYLINPSNIRKFKKGSILVNTARGEVCDTEAILIGLNEGILSGVGLDVVEGERHKESLGPIFKELLGHKDVFVTPHMAFFSREARQEIIATTIGNIVAYIKGELKNVANL